MVRSLLLLLAVICSSALAFCPPATTTTTTFAVRSPLAMSDMRADDPDDAADQVIAMVPLALKFAGVVAIKTAKDVVNYPPKMMESVLNKGGNGENDALQEMSPLVMLFKLLGVLVFKTGHDLVYFPTLWVQRLVECQSTEECDV
eukprot:CAMPEP_0119006248 /NCGR_PEP_ID=MMETSP1176-20130426/2188_1 /TAXON_ID=265551 /ORGANISM="Synedropsis recta cf, Strain CCMP1620" /LENGTH=144 /DNA_ID=CAMNT_0006958143 /DNA_START=163 /DNA_END=597 /DNA_ORIENTATION=-